MATMPLQKPGESKQDYGTPPEVLAAVRKKLGITEFDIDLAASYENKVCASCYTELTDSLSHTTPWKVGDGWNWLNPPYAKIEPWVYKAWSESLLGAKTAVLVPAGVGSNWWGNWVHGKAHTLLMHGRVQFVGAEGLYPKDTVVLLYASMCRGGYEFWNWRD